MNADLPGTEEKAVLTRSGPHELAAALTDRLKEEVAAFYGDRLWSLVVFGSVARGNFGRSSDLDFLIVAEPLPEGRLRRMDEFSRVEERLEPMLEACRKEGWGVELSPVFKTREGAEVGSPLFFDFPEDAKIVLDREAFMERRLERLRERMAALGSRRIWKDGGTWTWVLKPDLKPGEVVSL